MTRKAYAIALVAISSLLTWEAPAWAGDPSQIGKHVENVISPNAKSFWKIGLLLGAVYVVLSRPKPGLIAAIFLSIVISGMVIYNPDGFSNTVTNMANKVL